MHGQNVEDRQGARENLCPEQEGTALICLLAEEAVPPDQAREGCRSWQGQGRSLVLR